MKWKNIINVVFLVNLLAACSTPGTPAPTPTPTPLLTVKALTYNILFGAGLDHSRDDNQPKDYKRFIGRDRTPLLMSYLKEVDADIIGMQEVEGWLKGSPPFIETFAAELGLNYFLPSSDLEYEDVAILTKYEIAEAEDYTNEMGFLGGALRAKLITPDGAPLNVFVVHLNSTGSDDTLFCGAQFMLAKMQPYSQQRTIYIGDMNIAADSTKNDMLIQAGWQMVAYGTEGQMQIGIDQIWVSPSVEWGAGTWRTHASDGYIISDHYPVGKAINIFSAPGDMQAVIVPTATETISMPDLPPLVADSVANPQLIKAPSFDSVCENEKYWSWSNVKFIDGLLEVKGLQDWQSGANFLADVSEGNGTFLSFRFTPGSEFNIFLDKGSWADPAYRRFGVYYNGDTFSSDIWKGENALGGDVWEMKANPDTWYNLLLTVDKDAHFTGYLWNPTDPSNVAVYHREMEADWVGLTWRLSIGANKGLIQIDNTYLIQFDGIQ